MNATSICAVILAGWLDGYYGWNSGHSLNFYPGIGTTGERANQLALNVAALDLVRDPKPFGFHLTLTAGDSADVVHAAEPNRDTRHVYQASVTYDAKVVQLEAGIYPSHIGFEAYFSKDNWNYTRGWLGELSPYYQTGVKASRTINKHWSAQLHVLRGWQNVSDSRAPKALGTQIAYNDTNWSASYNTYLDNHRKFGDLAATYKFTPKLSLGASIDHGHQSPANWLGLAAYARYALDDRNALAFRAEHFRDPGAGISGFAQTLGEQTLTYELRPRKHLILKLEGRRDHSTAPVFNNSTDQKLAIASAVVTFGS
ncbi:MAG TPA: outer membrane beta-barrel protein [Thermoanaerobaculia bacterium]